MKHTPLYAIHEHCGAKFGSFAGYEMPLFYTAGIIKEHLHTRESAGLFDISHMMHVELSGKDAAKMIACLCPLEPENQQIGEARYTFFLNENAGIIDDLIVTRLAEDRFLLVCNAGRAEVDWAHIESALSGYKVDAIIQPRGFIALQGPKALSVLEDNGVNVDNLGFMQAKNLNENWVVARSGYTGEDGFEIATPKNEIEEFANSLLADERVLPIGLGARDSLRLEAGLSLYGQDLDTDTTPMEAGLTWAIPKNIRANGEFIGAKSLEEKIASKRKRKRIGLVPEGKAPIRAGAPITDRAGSLVGTITSGSFGPSVGHPIAMGMINIEADLQNLVAEVRGRKIPLISAPLPFVTHKYKR